MMKKILFFFLTISILTTTTWADISEKQLDTYMKASGAKVLLKNIQKRISSTPIMKENLEKFTKGIKSLDEKDYYKIIKFYDTRIGQKNAVLAGSLYVSNFQKKLEEFSKKKFYQERELLISKLVKLSMFEKELAKMLKVVMQITLDAMPQKMQIRMKEKMDKVFLTEIEPKIKKEAKLTIAYRYRDYSDEELQLLINYYKTTSAQMERDAIIDGTVEYFKVVISQIIKMKKMRNSQF